jgi:hypothetical protein
MRRHPTDPRSHHAESDRHSTTTGLHGATGPSAFSFAPLWDDIGRAVWTTEVDRILVLSVEVIGTATIWLRLIGPRNALNLKPSTKVTRQSILRWRWTRKPCPNRATIWRSIGLEHGGACSQTYTSTSINTASASGRSPKTWRHGPIRRSSDVGVGDPPQIHVNDY